MNDAPRTTGFDWYGKSPSGVEMALHVELADVPHLDQLVKGLADADRLLTAAKFTRSDRLDKPTYGNKGRPGAPRPEEPPPPDLVVPEHCGVSMVYKPAKPAEGDRKAVSPRWVCRKGQDCAEPEERGGNRYPATNWHLTKKAVEANGTQPGAMHYGAFLTEAHKLGYNRIAVLKLAQTDEAHLQAMGAEEWTKLLQKMRAAVPA